MGCACDRGISPEDIINEFWSGLKIRSKQIKDVVDIIRTKKSGTQDIKEKKWELLVTNLIEHPKYIEETSKLFNNALEVARSKKNEGLLFMSLLFICQSDKDEFYKSFLSLAMTQGGLKDYISLGNEENSNFIQSEKIKELLLFYVDLLSLQSAKTLTTIMENATIACECLSNSFSPKRQEEFVGRIMKKYQGEDKIEIEVFIRDNLEKLKNDKEIRQELISITES